MAAPLLTLACACASSLPASPVSHLHPNSSSSPQPQQLSAAFRRASTPLGKHLESGHGAWANPLGSSHSLKAISNSERESSSASASSGDENDRPPPGCSRIKVELPKPLGIALEEDKAGNIIVGAVIVGGNAYKSGMIDAGDQLIATSGIIYGSEEDYQGVMVRKGMQKIRLNVRGERFETVIAAIGSHPGSVKVAMEFQKCKSLPREVLNGSTRS